MIVKFCIMLLLLGAFSPPTLFAEKIIADGSSESPTVIEPLTSCPDGVFFSKKMSHRVHVHFNSLFPLGGMVSLNNGFLTLKRDLYCASNMSFMTGGHCNGQHNTIFLPYSKEKFLFPSQSLWLPPSDEESSEEEATLYLPNLETAPIASWHSLAEINLLAVTTPDNRAQLSIYTFIDAIPKKVAICSFPAPLTNLYWSPGHYAGIAKTEEGLSYFSFDLSRNTINQLPPLDFTDQTIPPAWSSDGKYCAIEIKSSTPVIEWA